MACGTGGDLAAYFAYPWSILKEAPHFSYMLQFKKGNVMKILMQVALVVLFSSASLYSEQTLSPSMASAIEILNEYEVFANVVYSVGSGFDSKLDAYVRKNVPTAVPVVVVIHGGGWVAGDKEGRILEGLPYLEMGFDVVNVEYRLARIAPAPAAVQDCRLALQWVFANAARYNFDTSKVVVTGGSAGGHLALMTGLLRASDGFDAPNGWNQNPPATRVAAIINWFGIADVADLLDGPNRQQYAVSWIGMQPEPQKVAASVSPLTYVRPESPPVLTVHGDKDELVPYQHAVRLHKALDAARVPNQLISIPGGRHGGFSPKDYVSCYEQIVKFLAARGIKSLRP